MSAVTADSSASYREPVDAKLAAYQLGCVVEHAGSRGALLAMRIVPIDI